MKKIIILGAGMVGSAMAVDLAKKYKITSVDINETSLRKVSAKGINTKIIDVSNEAELHYELQNHDLVISAVPGFLGLQTMLSVIKAKKDLVDISFLPESIFEYDQLAKDNGVTVIMDCGVAPGVPNIVAGYYNEIMEIDRFFYMVGGLPKERKFPFEYKAPFSPCDVIEEYTRPARFKEDGTFIIKPAMSELELINFKGIGTLEAFNSDGLRSLLITLKHIPNLKEKTLRYPGHIKMIQALMSAGFFSKDKLTVDGNSITPFDFTSEILFDNWKLGEEELEFTAMRIELEGKEKEVHKKITYEVVDEFDSETKTSSMARTTGYTGTAAANLILENKFNEKGIFPPELVGKHKECYEYFFEYFNERNIKYTKHEEIIVE